MTMMCTRHPGSQVVERLEDYHCHSIVHRRAGWTELVLYVTARIHVVREFSHQIPNCDFNPRRREGPSNRMWLTLSYIGEDPSPEALRELRNEIQSSIHDGWNEKLLLVDSRPGRHREIRCAVNLRFTETEAERPHLRIQLLYRPRAARGTSPRQQMFRASCARGGARLGGDSNNPTHDPAGSTCTSGGMGRDPMEDLDFTSRGRGLLRIMGMSRLGRT